MYNHFKIDYCCKMFDSKLMKNIELESEMNEIIIF